MTWTIRTSSNILRRRQADVNGALFLEGANRGIASIDTIAAVVTTYWRILNWMNWPMSWIANVSRMFVELSLLCWDVCLRPVHTKVILHVDRKVSLQARNAASAMMFVTPGKWSADTRI